MHCLFLSFPHSFLLGPMFNVILTVNDQHWLSFVFALAYLLPHSHPLVAINSDKINETEEIDHTRRYPSAAQCILCCSLQRSLITQKYLRVCTLCLCKLSGRSQCPQLPSCTWHTSFLHTHSHGQLRHPSSLSALHSNFSPPSCTCWRRAVCSGWRMRSWI